MPILSVPVTGLYAALFALLLVALSINVIRCRVSARVGLGDGGDPGLLRAGRAQGNFIEYVPLALIVILALELNHADRTLLHALGIALLLGRISHAYALVTDRLRFRQAGMILTFGVLLVGAVALLAKIPL